MPTRRATLAFAAGSLLAPAVVAADAADRPFNTADPVDNLDALIRIYAANDGTTFYWYAKGRIYDVRPGEVAHRLFDAAAMQWIRFLRQPDGTFHQQSAFAQLHYDEAGRVIETAVNPVTGLPFKVPVMASGDAMSRMEFSVNGVRRLGSSGAPEHISDKPMIYEWKIDGDDVVLTYEAMSRYQAPWMPMMATENSVRFYMTSLAQLNDRRRAAVRATRFEYAETPFLPWLEMPKDQAGHMMWRFTASKHAGRDAIPENLRADMKRHAPAFYDGFMAAG